MVTAQTKTYSSRERKTAEEPTSFAWPESLLNSRPILSTTNSIAVLSNSTINTKIPTAKSNNICKFVSATKNASGIDTRNMTNSNRKASCPENATTRPLQARIKVFTTRRFKKLIRALITIFHYSSNIKTLIHCQCWIFMQRNSHNRRWNSCYGDMRRNIVENQTSCSYFNAIANIYIAQNFGSS